MSTLTNRSDGKPGVVVDGTIYVPEYAFARLARQGVSLAIVCFACGLTIGFALRGWIA